MIISFELMLSGPIKKGMIIMSKLTERDMKFVTIGYCLALTDSILNQLDTSKLSKSQVSELRKNILKDVISEQNKEIRNK